MPTGGIVIDAFKNLIRHGKHDRVHHAVDGTAQKNRDKDQLRATQNQQGSTKKGDRAFVKDSCPSPNYRREVELIVQEENEAKGRLPTYKGLENFKLLEKMGDGAFSNVYKALDLTKGEKVAVKVVRKFELSVSQDGNKHLNPQLKKRPKATERANILKEVQIMRGINHPCIVKLLDFFESDEYYFLVLELMEGGELFHQIVKLTYFSEALSRHVILQVADGIRYLHKERGVVHRDIKPENLLFERIPIIPAKQPPPRQFDEEKEEEGEFTPDVGGGGIGRVKIADFGLSKVVWNEQTMTPCGTVGYTAPEIVKDERYSKSVDMWALGCVLYTLLCGFPPFYDESINVLTEKVAKGYFTFLSPWWDDISDSAKDLVSHLLCVDPARRYTIDEFFDHPWCNEDVQPPPPTPHVTSPDNQVIDSPLLHSLRGAKEARSPGIHSLKEAFDITYAVHRMEEEGARRRAYNGPGGAGVRGFLQGLNEDDEEDSHDSQIIEGAQKREVNVPSNVSPPTNKQTKPNLPPRKPRGNERLGEGRAGPRDRMYGGQKGFELDINGATLLGRRHRKLATAESSDTLQQVVLDGSRSPMQVG